MLEHESDVQGDRAEQQDLRRTHQARGSSLLVLGQQRRIEAGVAAELGGP